MYETKIIAIIFISVNFKTIQDHQFKKYIEDASNNNSQRFTVGLGYI